MCIRWPQIDLEQLTVKSTLYTLNPLPLRPKFLSIFLHNKLFSRYKVAEKLEIYALNDLEHLIVKSNLYTLNTYSRKHRFSSISCYDQPFSRYKVAPEMHQMTTEWPWTLKCQRYSTYTEYLLPTPKFSFVSLNDQRFDIQGQKLEN